MKRLAWLVLIAACARDPGADALEGCMGRYGSLTRLQPRGEMLPVDSDDLGALMQPQGQDPWGHDYVAEMDQAGIVVWSWGEDGEPETDDDICWPPSD